MDTDKLAYEIFAIDPGSFFEILGQPRSEAKHYVFHAVDLKAVERRVDGYFAPKDASRPFYFSEVFFYKKENAYANVFAKVFLKLEQMPTHPWRVAMLFESRSLEPADLSAYAPLLASGWVHRIYLDEVKETSQSGFGLSILKLASTTKAQTIDRTIQLADRLADQVRSEADHAKYLALIEYIVTSKLPGLSREEFGAMLNLNDYRKSRVYKETWEEASEASRQATLADVIGKMSKHGIPPDNIAQTLEIDLAVVKNFLRKKRTKK